METGQKVKFDNSSIDIFSHPFKKKYTEKPLVVHPLLYMSTKLYSISTYIGRVKGSYHPLSLIQYVDKTQIGLE